MSEIVRGGYPSTQSWPTPTPASVHVSHADGSANWLGCGFCERYSEDDYAPRARAWLQVYEQRTQAEENAATVNEDEVAARFEEILAQVRRDDL